MKDTKIVQGILSIAILICLVIGWFGFFTPEVNDFLYKRLFYILVGMSFFFLAPTIQNQKFIYLMYLGASLCIIGAFFPLESKFSIIKTIGLLIGVVLSLFNRSKSNG